MSKNAEIAEIFEQIAGMLSILDENPFKIRAYKKAALNIQELEEEIEKISQKVIEHGKFKIYDIAKEIFDTISFQIKKL